MKRKKPLPVWVAQGPGHILPESASAGVPKVRGKILGSVWEARGQIWAQVGANQAWVVPTVQAGKRAVEAVVQG